MTKPSAEALKKPYLLIDTANDTLSLAVIADGKVLSSFSEAVFRDMAARLQPEMQNVLQSAQMNWPELGGILFNQGPGSFTSITTVSCPGPLALVDEDMPVVSVAPSDSLLEKLRSKK